jgi:hypothetical protein
MSTAIEIVGLLLIIAGVVLLAGPAWGLIVGGVALVIEANMADWGSR